MNANEESLGIVQDGLFYVLPPRGAEGIAARLTTIQMSAAMAPEMHKPDLTPYEGQAIMVQGHASGGWIYSARVIDQAGPILTAVVRQVFGHEPQSR